MEWSEKNEGSTPGGRGGEGGGGGGGVVYCSENAKRAKLNSTLAALLDDPILSDVPKKPSLSDVDTLISLELGSAMRISVLKLDSTSFGIFSLFFLSSIFTNSWCAFSFFTSFLLSHFSRCCGHEFGYGEGFETVY